MNKMYEYLKNHAYISYNKKSTYEFELSEERAECIANKYDSLTDELQQENKQLKDNWNKLREYLFDIRKRGFALQNLANVTKNTEPNIAILIIINKMQEMEKNYGDVENNT